MTEPTTAIVPELTPTAAEHYRSGPGQRIREAREHAGLGVAELATQLRLARGTLEALERDDFQTLSQPVYVRGYYRKCAKALQIPEADLLGAYERLAVPKAPQIPSKLLLSGRDAGHGIGRWLKRLLWLVVLAGVVLAATTWLRDSEGPHWLPVGGTAETAPTAQPLASNPHAEAIAPPAAAPPVGPTSESTGAQAPPSTAHGTVPSAANGLETAAHPVPPSSAAPADTFATAAPGRTPPVAATPSPAASSEAASVTGAPAVAATEPVQAAAGATVSGEVSVRVSKASWVQIKDVHGKALLTDLLHAGTEKTVQGAPPLAIFIGYAPGVSLSYNGVTVDLGPYTRDNDTARLRLPSETPTP